MSWYLPPYNMEVAIVVIVVFIVVLLLVIVMVRLCTKYNCVSCCDSDTDSVDDLEEELNDDDDDDDDDQRDDAAAAAANQSDCADDDVDEHHPQLTTTSADVGAGRMLDRDLEAGCYDDEEEVSQGVDYPGLAHDCPVFRGGRLQMEDEDGGDEFLINKMEESLL